MGYTTTWLSTLFFVHGRFKGTWLVFIRKKYLNLMWYFFKKSMLRAACVSTSFNYVRMCYSSMEIYHNSASDTNYIQGHPRAPRKFEVKCPSKFTFNFCVIRLFGDHCIRFLRKSGLKLLIKWWKKMLFGFLPSKRIYHYIDLNCSQWRVVICAFASHARYARALCFWSCFTHKKLLKC